VNPTANPSDDLATLRDNLMSKYVYRGYADPSVRPEPEARATGFGYVTAFSSLLEQEYASGRSEACRAALARYLSAFPPERLGFEEVGANLRASCG
jgi:hypothetical protein